VAVDPFVAPTLDDAPRRGLPLPPAPGWRADRPGDLGDHRQPRGALLGSPGPDLGYALRLAEDLAPRLQLALGEHRKDAVAAVTAIAMKRASLVGRAPVGVDLELAATLLGYLGGAPDELVAWRAPRVHGAAHHYPEARAIADGVSTDALRLQPAGAAGRLAAEWRALLGAY
jgi:hypothetical protein